MISYLKTNSPHTMFVDLVSGVKILPKRVVKIEGALPKKVQQWVRAKGLLPASQEEYDAQFPAAPSAPSENPVSSPEQGVSPTSDGEKALPVDPGVIEEKPGFLKAKINMSKLKR